MLVCRMLKGCTRAKLTNSVRPWAQNFNYHSRAGARRRLQWWVLPAALLTGGYVHYKYRHQLRSMSSVTFNTANQLNDKNEFRVSVAGDKNENMDLKRDAGEWMPQVKDIGISNTRRAVVFSIGMGGKRSRDFYMMSQ